MKAVILAGGFGTRISEENAPKPMVEIGGRPILWHIMKYYSHFGINEFVILLGYKSYYIKEYFANYYLHQSDVTIDTANSKMKIHSNTSEEWMITLVDTGLHTMTGGRIKRAQKYIGDETFMLTYGDGVSDVNLTKLLEHHKESNSSLTLTAIQPEGRFGSIDIGSDSKVNKFLEKPKGDGSWINGGYFICEPEVFNYLNDGDETIFERAPLENMVKDKKLSAYKHDGFWMCMDTLRDKVKLCEMWNKDEAPWKRW